MLRTLARSHEKPARRAGSRAPVRKALANPLNRVSPRVANSRVAEVRPDADGAGGTVVAKAAGKTTLTLAYQREHAAGDYFDVFDDAWPVLQTVDIKVTGG
jgi:hypothetical protein